MRKFFKILVLIIVFCMQIVAAKAQNSSQDNISEIYGIYEGTATTILFNNKNQTKQKGNDKKLIIEIKKGQGYYTVIALKDITIGKYTFAEIPYTDCELKHNNNIWEISLINNLHGEFKTKDNHYSIILGGYIDDTYKNYVNNNGDLELKFGLFLDSYTSEIEYTFKGKLKRTTNSIKTITDKNKKNTIYNLQGVRVETPSKGIYIVNGKKVVF